MSTPDTAVFIGPEPSPSICWTCERPIAEGTGRNKNGWLVHELCPIPSLICTNCGGAVNDGTAFAVGAFGGALYHPYAEDPSLPCGPVELAGADLSSTQGDGNDRQKGT